VLSLIVWSLIIVVTLKYVLVLLRADNNGEGGTLSLWRSHFARSGGARRLSWRSASSAPRCSTARRSSRRRCRSCRPSKV
jgi:hypothetical protein